MHRVVKAMVGSKLLVIEDSFQKAMWLEQVM